MFSSSLALSLLLLPMADPAYEPTSHYEEKKIEGWQVYVNRRLFKEEQELGEKVLRLLRVKLYDINRVVPKKPLEELHKVPIWLEVDDDKNNPCACYHVSKKWLLENGFNPAKAKSVEICNARRFLEWTLDQPSMILHELVHGYHDRVFTYEEPRIKEAFQQAVDSGKYKKVLRFSGRRERHYALTNQMEYFAEACEAYFGTNDFFPFVRAELQQHDPVMFKLMQEIWQDTKAEKPKK